MGKSAIWRERAVDGAVVAALVSAGQTPAAARILAARGIGPDGLETFLDPSLVRLEQPRALPGVGAAVKVVLPFLRDRRKIVVFGDYDVDGVCASAILVTALRRLGGVVDAFLPRRLGEGYGMTSASLARLLREHPDVALVVTVDNGISSPDEVADLRSRGIAVVVTDHHLPGERLPAADALVDPRVDTDPPCEPTCRSLCGAGVAFFLASALVEAARTAGLYAGPRIGGPLLVLAGLATIADAVPVLDQNRVLVCQSLRYFDRYAPLGLRELLARAARSANALVARDYGFTLAPRLNAAGRIDDARFAYDLLMCEDREAARLLASKIEGFNGERRGIEASMFAAACEQVGSPDGLQAAVVRNEVGWEQDKIHGWHPGAAGIVASRLLEKYHVPAAVAVGDTGSVRAPDGFNIHAALSAASAYLVRFGGHAAAGGFTIRPGAFAAFKEAFSAACASQAVSAPDAGAVSFDGWLEPHDLTVDLARELRRFEPFGENNPEPVFGLRGAVLKDIGVMGLEGKHLSVTFAGRDMPRAVWWGHGADAEALRARASTPFDILFALMISDYGGVPEHVELRLVALRPSAAG